MENGKVTSNPARLVRMRREDNARLRFLSRDEFESLSEIILRDSPKQHAAFVVSVYIGMRWGEQFSLRWSQVDLVRWVIRLTQTKNGSARNVPLNSISLETLQRQRSEVPHKTADPVFPLHSDSDRCRWWFEPALAEAKITGYTWHNNRHTFCSWLAMAEYRSKRFRPWRGTKPSRWLPAIPIYRRMLQLPHRSAW